MGARRATKPAKTQRAPEGGDEHGGDPVVDPIPPADLDELPRGESPANERDRAHGMGDASDVPDASDASDGESAPMDPRRVCLVCGDDVSAGVALHGEGACAHRECARVLRADKALRAALRRVLEASDALHSAQRALHGALTAAVTRGEAEIEAPVEATAAAREEREAREAGDGEREKGATVEPCSVCAARDAQVEAVAARKSERRRRPGGLPAAQTAFRFVEPVREKARDEDAA